MSIPVRERQFGGVWSHIVVLVGLAMVFPWSGAYADVAAVTDLSSSTHAVNTRSSNATISFSWTAAVASNGETLAGYSYVLDTSATTIPDANIDLSSSATGVSKTVTASSSAYYLHLKAIGSSGSAATIHLGPFNIDIDAPAQLSNISVEAGDSQLTLSWNNPSDADLGEVIIRRDTGNFPSTTTSGSAVATLSSDLTPGGSKSFTDSNLSNGTTYNYSLFALDNVGNVSTVGQVSGTPAGSAAITLSAVAPGAAPIDVQQDITITGTNFPDSTPTLTVGGLSATSISRDSDTTVTATLAANLLQAGVHDVVLQFTGQQALTLTNGFTSWSLTGATQQGTDGLSVTGESLPNQTVTITVAGSDATAESRISATSLTATLPTGLNDGTLSVLVSFSGNPSVTASTSLTYASLSPLSGTSISAVSPTLTSGSETTLTITGTGFPQDTPTVTLGGTTLSAVNRQSDTTVSALMPAAIAAGTYTLTMNFASGFVSTQNIVIAEDNTPDAFSFTALTDQTSASAVTSNGITVAGLGAGVAASVSADTGTLVINGVDCLSSCTASNDDLLAVRLTSSAAAGTEISSTVTLGTVQSVFSVTTAGSQDTTPDAFSFTALTDQTTGAQLTSNAITVAGLGSGVAASVTADSSGTLVINGSECVSNCTVSNGDLLAVRVTASSSASTTVSSTVTLGGTQVSFSVTTAATNGGSGGGSTGGGSSGGGSTGEGDTGGGDTTTGPDTVDNSGQVLTDTDLEAGANYVGGTLSGSINGDAVDPPTINATIADGTVLTNVIIGDTAVIDGDIVVGTGTQFESNTLIPDGIDLSAAFGVVASPLPAIDQPAIIDLSSDIVSSGDSVLDSMRNIFTISLAGGNLEQGSDGVLELALDGLITSLIPTRVQQAETGFEAGISVSEDGNVVFTTADGRQVESKPAVNDLVSLDDALSAAAFDFSVDNTGVVNIVAAGAADSYAARPAAFAGAAADGAVEGVMLGNHSLLANVATVILIYEENGSLMQQELYSTPADWEGMQNMLNGIGEIESVTLGLDGVINITVDGVIYRGVMSYQLDPVTVPPQATTVTAVPDANGDGIDDFRFAFPNGFAQIMYFIPAQ